MGLRAGKINIVDLHRGIANAIPYFIGLYRQKKYKQLGEFGLMDQRGRREEYIDQDRYVQKLKRENSMLKKCLKIWIQEVQPVSIQRSNR